MKLVDANVLLYAVNEDADRHASARTWLDAALSGGETVAFAWLALLAFVRLATKEGLFPRPLSLAQAMGRVDAWLAAPTAVIIDPSPDHGGVVRRLLAPLGAGGNLVSDAHLAALAVEHRCTVVSYDHGFGRSKASPGRPPSPERCDRGVLSARTAPYARRTIRPSVGTPGRPDR